MSFLCVNNGENHTSSLGWIREAACEASTLLSLHAHAVASALATPLTLARTYLPLVYPASVAAYL